MIAGRLKHLAQGGLVWEAPGMEYGEELNSWLQENRHELGAQGVEVKLVENPDSAGSDPIMMLELWKDTRGGVINIWRHGVVGLDIHPGAGRPVETDNVPQPSQEEFRELLATLHERTVGGTIA